MNLNDEHQSLYDALELTPDATPQEIRSAYLRLKSAYGKDNIAHYTLFSRDETEKMLQNIENAYVTLSNPEKRKGYDHSQGHGHMPLQDDRFVFTPPESRAAEMATSPVAVENAPSDLEIIIQNEQEWSGAAIRRAREARRISLDDLCDYTRISKTYLQALEDDDFNKLPAAVYVRGFLQQVGKRLKLPVEELTQKYLQRLKIARPDK